MAVKLVNITDYAAHYKIDRKTVYNLIEKGEITRYEDPNGVPLLNLLERPSGIKRYGKIRQRRIR